MFEREFLKGASALVTGGTRFIGRKVKGFLADSGASIALSLGSGMLGPRKIACGSRGWMLEQEGLCEDALVTEIVLLADPSGNDSVLEARILEG